jgi:hypothetical protein
MRKATKRVTTWLGISAGLAGIEHGYFEILQGNTHPTGLVIASIGPPCVPEEIWNTCEPAMTLIPNFLITGIIAVVVGLLALVWSAAFVGHKHGGLVLILLSVILLLFGGGFFPPLIGIVAGITGLKINNPIEKKQRGAVLQFAARLWPWPLVIFFVWIWAQWVVGYFFNEFLQEVMIYGVILILVTLYLSAYTGYAFDIQTAQE